MLPGINSPLHLDTSPVTINPTFPHVLNAMARTHAHATMSQSLTGTYMLQSFFGPQDQEDWGEVDQGDEACAGSFNKKDFAYILISYSPNLFMSPWFLNYTR